MADSESNVEVLLAQWSGKTIGFALFFENFSTFLGKPGLYLEDSFVQSDFQGEGVGTALVERLIEIAKERNYGRVEWAVLDWNEPAIKFYEEKVGAKLMSSWRICGWCWASGSGKWRSRRVGVRRLSRVRELR